MKKNHVVLAIILVLAALSCKKSAVDIPKNETVVSAQNILIKKMAPVDFAGLDWPKAVVKKLDGKDFLVEIPSTTEPGKTLYFTNYFGVPLYNWVKLQKTVSANGKSSGTLTITGVDNQVLNSFAFADNKVTLQQGTALNKEVNSIENKNRPLTEDDGITLPPVTVTAYLNNYYYDYSSLYWWFNQNMSLLPFYDGDGNTPIIDANYKGNAFGTYSTIATRDVLSDGSIQIKSLYPNAFLLSPLDLKFTYDPKTLQLNTSSVVSNPVGGLFAGNWTANGVGSIAVLYGNTIVFQYSYTNSYVISGITFSKNYTMGIVYDTSTNTIYWTWQ